MEKFSVHHLTVARANTPVVTDADFSLRPGELLAITGANGSGKSSLLSALAGYPTVQIAQGSIHLEEEDLTALPLHERARRGVLLAHQEPPTLPGISGLHLLRLAREARTGACTYAHAGVLARGIAEELGMSEEFLTRETFVDFSGGEKKRLELLSVLALDPQVLLLDEIDAGLDAATLDLAAQAILRRAAAGVVVVIVSHQEEFLTRFPTARRMTLCDGRLN